MTLEHVALWTEDLERSKDFYQRFFGGKPNNLYHNTGTGFKSYFLTFSGGARLELMFKPDIPHNKNDTKVEQHLGLIHLAFGAKSEAEVDEKFEELAAHGYPVLRGPRTTGDGYYEFETLDPSGNRIEVTFKK